MFVFFKQKTAYEMRISDWSSDVCSSDLLRGANLSRANLRGTSFARATLDEADLSGANLSAIRDDGQSARTARTNLGAAKLKKALLVTANRSEEHTSELQSLMRISYAVFCLKKKKKPLS